MNVSDGVQVSVKPKETNVHILVSLIVTLYHDVQIKISNMSFKWA